MDYPEVEVRAIWSTVLQQLSVEGLVEGVVDDASVAHFAILFEAAANPTWPMPHAREVLLELRERGLRLGIVSNAQFYTPVMWQALFGAPLGRFGFDPGLCVWSWKEGVAKPSVQLFEIAAQRLHVLHGLAPGEVVFVGNDRKKDIDAAARCGFKTVLYAGDQRSLRLHETNADLAEPDAVIVSLAQICGLISSA